MRVFGKYQPFDDMHDRRSLLRRLRQLNRTARRVWEEQGVLAVIKRSLWWLLGERGYYRTLSIRTISFETYRNDSEPQPSALHQQRQEAATLRSPVLFALLTLVQTEAALQNTLVSVQAQTYPHWQWYIVAKEHFLGSTPDLETLVRTDPRVILITSLKTLPLCEGSQFVLFLEAGDELAPHALYRLAKTIQEKPEIECIYSDIDQISASGDYCEPFFKPDWSPELLLSVNYLFPFGGCHQKWWAALQPFTGHWDFALRLSEHVQQIEHVPYLLYHQRPDSAPSEPIEALLLAYLARQGIKAPSIIRRPAGTFGLRWTLSDSPLISIVIPSRNQPELIEACLSSLFTLTDYPYFEVILVDTGSTIPEVLALYERFTADPRFHLIDYPGEFNFSRACNWGAAHSRGELLLFLNNDTRIIQRDWLQLLSQWFEIDGIGIVGAKLLYPHGKIQHAGVIVGMSGLADNLFTQADEHSTSIYGSVDWYRNFLAVTGACLMIPRRIFDLISGFDDAYQLVFSDVDLCLRVHEAGYRILYTPDVVLIHHEATTHRYRIPNQDVWLGIERHLKWLRHGDPYFNPNLSYHSRIPTFRSTDDDFV